MLGLRLLVFKELVRHKIKDKFYGIRKKIEERC
jgi:hypothetical protein